MDITEAKNVFDRTLKAVYSKKKESESDGSQERSVKSESDDLAFTLSTFSPSPRKQQRPGARRKRRRFNSDLSQIGYFHHTYVMRLFDRSVDLAQFGENTALYPVCRAWMKDNVKGMRKGSAAGDTSTEDQKPEEVDMTDETQEELERSVYTLPPPIKVKAENGGGGEECEKMFHIPKPLQDTVHKFDDIFTQDGQLKVTSNYTREEMLSEHLIRWKQIREQWAKAYQDRDALFEESFKVLRNIFYNSLKINISE